jgi:hypothetical protein
MEVEISQLNLKHQYLRLCNPRKERALLSSLQEEGFYEGLGCICVGSNEPILLEGFKRYRCAQKLKMRTVPIVNIGDNEVAGIFQLLRNNNSRALTVLEQAALVDELHRGHNLSASEIARKLDRSAAWVSVRRDLLAGMSNVVSEAIFSGAFPVRSYMYTLRPFTRVKGVTKKDVDDFVKITGGKNLGSRDIQTLANAFFKGTEEIRTQIREGNLDWSLRQLKKGEATGLKPSSSMNQFEQGVLNNLQCVQRLMSHLALSCNDERLNTPEFFTRAAPARKEIIRQLPYFTAVLEHLHD